MVYSGIQLQRRFACFFFWWVLSAIFDPNFFSQSRQGNSKWYLRLWALKSLLFWNILSQFLQENVIWSILCMFALCSLKRSGVTKVFPHTMHKLSRGMILLCAEITWFSSLFFSKYFFSQSLQEKVLVFELCGTFENVWKGKMLRPPCHRHCMMC